MDLANNPVLIVAPPPAAGPLLEQCARMGWKAAAVGRCADAVTALKTCTPCVVFSADSLPDGDWRRVLSDAAAIRPDALCVVFSSRCTLPLWMDVLASGGHELLPEPCPEELLERVFNRARQARDRACESA